MVDLTDADAIQKEFFRCGAGTDLSISTKVVDQHVTEIRWTFWFHDMGMCHMLKGTSRVIVVGRVAFVNGLRARTTHEARVRVYGGRFSRFLRRLHRGLGVRV